MFITNNHDSFHLWWHENFFKHQNVSKYYDQDCSIIDKHDQAFWSISITALQYLKKKFGMEFVFCKLALLFLLEVARHVQSIQNRKLVIFCNILRKKWCNCFCVLLWCKAFRYFTGVLSGSLLLVFSTNISLNNAYVLYESRCSKSHSLLLGFHLTAHSSKQGVLTRAAHTHFLWDSCREKNRTPQRRMSLKIYLLL